MRLRLILSIALTCMFLGTFLAIPYLPVADSVIIQSPIVDQALLDEEILLEEATKAIAEDSPYPADFDLDDLLGDRETDFRTIYEPWKSRAAIHAVAYDKDTGFLAVGGGYLYDNEVHLFRLNTLTDTFDKVMEIGDGVMRSDVLSIDFGDTDFNNFIEIVVGCSDGHVYVFEQRHLYDPYLNTENLFDLVWKSQGLFKVFAVKVDDVDRDYRPDIIVGSWDGKVHLFEYDNHSGYPFVEDHWIDYREVATLEVGEKIYTLETGDTNYNGLPEIVVGTRDGTVFVFENAGITLDINGQPFPLVRDNTYDKVWTSENYTWQPITSMAIGELDGSNGDEIALISEGQGVFTLDWDSAKGTYHYEKVQREYAEWETFGFHGLDYWVDSLVSANNVTYHDPINDTLVVYEPIEYEWVEDLLMFLPNASVYPYNTGMAQFTDGNYSLFDASNPSVDNATAIVDFGLDEEGTGSANSDPDVIITFKQLDPSVVTKFNFSIGQSATDFALVPTSKYVRVGNQLRIDVDDVMIEERWDWFRYAKLSVYNGGNYSINSIELKQVYNLLTEALSLTIGPFHLDGDTYFTGEPELDKIVLGTCIGEFIAVGYSLGDYEVLWESYDDERYKIDRYVWDLEYIETASNVPNFIQASSISLGAGTFNAWSHGIAAPLSAPGGDGIPRYFVGGTSYGIAAYDMQGEIDTEFNLKLSAIGTHSWKPYTAVELAWLWPEYGFLPTLVVSQFDPQAPYITESLVHGRAMLDFYTRYGPEDDYAWIGSIENFDWTGEITQLLRSAKTTPRLSFADVDSDGDLDFAISTGKVYLARNLLEEEGVTAFALDSDYFRFINEESASVTWGQPELHDIDADGDFDIILSFVGNYGVTTFINKGLEDEPVWEEDRHLLMNSNPDTALTTMHLTSVRFIPNTGGYTLQKQAETENYDLQGDYHWAAFYPSALSLIFAYPVYDSMDSYMIATYPYVSRMDFCLRESAAFRNLAFHVHEAWNTDWDLRDWTLSVSSGDLDGDGKGEIIVGDFDNNVYAFEHLRNNTYKRMFRSFDLNHTIVTDESPYAYGDLEGLSGDFYRKIFDHARHLISGTDLDQDSLSELIVASDLQVYIFEDTGVDDTLRFAYTIDLRDLGYLDPEFNIWEEIESITVMEAGSDLDSDGRDELLVGAGPYLLIYNVEVGDFQGMADNEFFTRASDGRGRYYLIGNPTACDAMRYAQISALAVGDTNLDGHPEVLLGGIDDTRLERSDGFLKIYECLGGTFREMWNAPSNITYWNPITSVILDDQDYDGYREIIVGHSMGFDILEWIDGTEAEYRVLETMSASPNYPRINTTSAISHGLFSFTEANRSHSELVWNPLYTVGLYLVTSSERLWWGPWFPSSGSLGVYDAFGPVFSLSDYGGGSTIDSEVEISSVLTDEGFYITWRTQRLDDTYDIWVSLYNFSTDDWENPVSFYSNSYSSRILPKIFEYNSTHMGIMYVQQILFGVDSLRYHILEKSLTGGWSSWSSAYTPNIPGLSNFDINSAHIIGMPSGEFALTFSAVDTSSDKSDADLFFIMANASFDFSNDMIHQVTDAYYDEIFPHMDYLLTDNSTIMIAYESRGATFEEKIGIVASRANGTSWTDEQVLNSYPNYLGRYEYPNGYGSYYDTTSMESRFGPDCYTPAILGLPTGGFVFTMPFVCSNPSYTRLCDILWGQVIDTQWMDTHLSHVDHMTVGDVDSDGRREVIAAFGNHFGVYELKHSTDGTGLMQYKESYLSLPFTNELTGLTVYDSNGNGWDEVAVSSRYGDVFVLEYPDPSAGATNFGYSICTDDIETYGMAWHTLITSYDVDADGKDELLLGPLGGGLQLFDDDGSVEWNITNHMARAEIIDIDGDTIPEIVGDDQDDHIIVYNAQTGAMLWNFSSLTGNFQDMRVADLNSDGRYEIIVGTDGGTGNGRIWIIHSNGTLWHVEDVDIGNVWAVEAGYFVESSTLTIAYANDTYAMKVIDPFDGTVHYETPNGMVPSYSPQPFTAKDMTGDGYDEVIFGNKAIRIANVFTGQIIFNLTLTGNIATHGLKVEDFDGDSTDELLVATQKDGVYLIEANTLRLQWHYAHKIGTTQNAAYGYFGGTGEIDVLLNLNSTSTMIALDGKSGLPMFMNHTGQYIQGLGAVDFDGDGVDAALVWQWPFMSSTSHLLFFQQADFETYSWKRAYEPHSEYWTMTNLTESYINAWSYNVDGDSIDEIVVLQENDLILIDSQTGAKVWTSSMQGTVSVVRFGNLNNIGNKDLVVLVDHDTVILLDGDTGKHMDKIVSPSSTNRIVDCEVGGFRVGTGYEYDEIVLLYDVTTGSKSYAVWYNYDLTLKYTSSVNGTGDGAYMCQGLFTGSVTRDIAFGCDDGIVRFYRGTDGVYQFGITVVTSGDKMVSGNIFGNLLYQGVAVKTQDQIHIINTNTLLKTATISLAYGTLKDIYISNVDGLGNSEVIAFVRNEGLVGFNSTGAELWKFDAPLRYPNTDDFATCSFYNLNGDSAIDIILTNYDYIDVISGSDLELLWHYHGEYDMTKAIGGRFDGTTSPYDVFFVSYDHIGVISGSQTPPPLLPPTIIPATVDFIPLYIAASSISVYPIVSLCFLIMYRRKRNLLRKTQGS